MSKVFYRPNTMMEVYKLLPEGTPVQLINNHLYMSPAPLFDHFTTIKNIFKQLDAYVEANKLGTTAFAPLDVYLGNTNAVQPDIFFIAKENEQIIQKNGIYGAPDLIIEVLSPGNKNDDLIKKKNVYESFGVKEYFIVEPADKSVITYYLKDKTFIEQKKTKGKLVSKIFKKTFSF